MLSLERAVRSGHPLRGEQRGKKSVASGKRGRSSFPKRKLSSPGVPHLHISHGGNSNGLSNHLGRQTQQMTYTGSGANTDDKALVPALCTQPRSIVEADKELIGNHHARQQAAAVSPRRFGNSEEGAQAVARMAARVLVVEVQVADHRGVYESCVLRRRSFTISEDAARVSLWRRAAGKTDADLGRLAPIGCDGAGEAIHHALRRGMDDPLRQFLKNQSGGIAGDEAS